MLHVAPGLVAVWTTTTWYLDWDIADSCAGRVVCFCPNGSGRFQVQRCSLGMFLFNARHRVVVVNKCVYLQTPVQARQRRISRCVVQI